MIVAAFDSGIAHCGFAAIDGDAQLLEADAFISHRDRDRTGDTQARLAEMLAWASECLRVLAAKHGSELDVLVIEWPIIGGRGQGGSGARSAIAGAMTFAAAGALIGMLRHRAPIVHSPVPVAWRSALWKAGDHDGRLDTETLLAEIDAQYGITERVGKGRAPHATDAVGLAVYGLQLHVELDIRAA